MSKKLIKSVFNNNKTEVEKLLKEGADINFIDEYQNTPLLVAIQNNYLGIAEFLLQNGANPNPDTNLVDILPLHEAIDTAVQMTNNDPDIKEDPLDMIKLLIKYGADVHLKDNSGESAYDFSINYHIPAQKLFENLLINNRK